jgi:two-component system, chemotaxis family, sensor histidine kinase and response regulator WspE
MRDDSMLELFRQEVETQLLILNQGLLALEANPQADEILEALMRAAHSIKGAARMVSLDAIVTLAHGMEDCFVTAQHQLITLGSDQIDVLLQGVDLLQALSQVSEIDLLQWLAEKSEAFDRCSSAIAALLPTERDRQASSIVSVDQNLALSPGDRSESCASPPKI